MKSFAARVRDALVREEAQRPQTAASRRATLAGLMLTCGAISLLGGGNLRLVLRSEHASVARLCARLLRGEFDIMPQLRICKSDRLGGQTVYEVRAEAEDAKQVAAALALTPLTQAIPRQYAKTQRGRDAFLKGVFLGCGTVSDPARGYQMEFLLASEAMADALVHFLDVHYGTNGGIHIRKGVYVVYLRDSDAIIQVLSGIGAHGAILDMENVRIMKDARNRANRAANCDSGNITKMLGAVGRQLDAIETIEQTIGLDALPDTLREVAIERKLHPDIPLEALGTLLEPPVGKSGVHHRLRRIEALAQSIQKKEGEEST